MKHLTKWLLTLVAVVLIAACAATASMSTFNDKAAAIDNTLQLAQTTSTALLRAKKITLAQDQNVQKQIVLLHESVVLAKTMQATDPAAADVQLTQAQGAVKSITTAQATTGAK